jgi:hypothetical protein
MCRSPGLPLQCIGRGISCDALPPPSLWICIWPAGLLSISVYFIQAVSGFPFLLFPWCFLLYREADGGSWLCVTGVGEDSGSEHLSFPSANLILWVSMQAATTVCPNLDVHFCVDRVKCFIHLDAAPNRCEF